MWSVSSSWIQVSASEILILLFSGIEQFSHFTIAKATLIKNRQTQKLKRFQKPEHLPFSEPRQQSLMSRTTFDICIGKTNSGLKIMQNFQQAF